MSKVLGRLWGHQGRLWESPWEPQTNLGVPKSVASRSQSGKLVYTIEFWGVGWRPEVNGANSFTRLSSEGCFSGAQVGSKSIQVDPLGRPSWLQERLSWFQERSS